MPKIEIIGPDMTEGIATTWGTRLLVDGQEIDEVREITVSIPLDGLLTVRTEVNVSGAFHFESGADLHVTVVTHPGFVVIAEPMPDGTTRYRAELVAPLS